MPNTSSKWKIAAAKTTNEDVHYHLAPPRLTPDDPYEPSWRFYFDAHRLIEASRVTRLIGYKVHHSLSLDNMCLAQISPGSLEATPAGPRTPRRFPQLADETFTKGRVGLSGHRPAHH